MVMILKMGANQTFRDVLDESVKLLASGCKDLILDFKDIDYMPSSIIGVIIALDKKFKDRNARLQLTNISEETSYQLNIFGLDTLIRR